MSKGPVLDLNKMSVQEYRIFRAELIELVRQSEASKDKKDWNRFLKERRKREILMQYAPDPAAPV